MGFNFCVCEVFVGVDIWVQVNQYFFVIQSYRCFLINNFQIMYQGKLWFFSYYEMIFVQIYLFMNGVGNQWCVVVNDDCV